MTDRIGPVVPSLYTPSHIKLSDAIAKAIADELASTPDDAVKLSVRYTDGDTLVSTIAYRNRFDNGWTLGAGVYAKKTKDRPVEVGIDTIVTF